MPSPTDAEFMEDITGCARCHGEGHEGLVFKKLTHPVETRTCGVWEIIASHWSTCPTTGEPIMLMFQPDEVVAAAMEDERGK